MTKSSTKAICDAGPVIHRVSTIEKLINRRLTQTDADILSGDLPDQRLSRPSAKGE